MIIAQILETLVRFLLVPLKVQLDHIQCLKPYLLTMEPLDCGLSHQASSFELSPLLLSPAAFHGKLLLVDQWQEQLRSSTVQTRIIYTQHSWEDCSNVQLMIS